MNLAREVRRNHEVRNLQVVDRHLAAEDGWHFEGEDLSGAGHEPGFGCDLGQSGHQVPALRLGGVDLTCREAPSGHTRSSFRPSGRGKAPLFLRGGSDPPRRADEECRSHGLACCGMSEETARELSAAREAEATRRREAREAEMALLRAIAQGLPGHAEQIARRVAHAQPDVTKSLGRDGVDQLRAELNERAAAVAAELAEAVDQIKWPLGDGGTLVSKTTVRTIEKVLFDYLYGSRVNSVAAALKRRGFDINETAGSQSRVLPQFLYSEEALSAEFEAVVTALNLLQEAQRALAKAGAEDDRDTVESLWQ